MRACVSVIHGDEDFGDGWRDGLRGREAAGDEGKGGWRWRWVVMAALRERYKSDLNERKKRLKQRQTRAPLLA